MKKVMGKIWTGLILNLLVMIAGIFSLSGEYGWSLFTKGFAAVMLLAFLTSLTGVIMLIRGNPWEASSEPRAASFLCLSGWSA